MNVTIEVNHPIKDKPCHEMDIISVGILTDVPEHTETEIGDPVIRVFNEIVFPKSETWSSYLNRYRFRPLLPGEKIIIEG